MSCPPRLAGCSPLCGHRAIVDAYRQERQRQEIVAENVTLGYSTEYREHVRDCPLITFKNWLIQGKAS